LYHITLKLLIMATVSIPKQQKAAIKQGEGADSKAPVQQIDVPNPGPTEVLVKINWCVPLPGLPAVLKAYQDWIVCF
jgi:hypothetical protein